LDSSPTQQPRNCSSVSAYFHIVCVVAGTGTLGLPYAMAQGGWISVLFFFIAAAMSTYTAKLLIECLYHKPGKRLDEFPDIGEAAFGLLGRYFTKIFHSSVSLSCGCIYILLTGHNTYLFLKDFSIEPISERMWILLAGVAVISAFSILKTMKEVALLSAFGTIATMICVAIVAIVGGIDYSKEVTHADTVIFNRSTFSMAIATIAFSYGGNVIYPHVEATMRNPRAWNKTVFYAVLSITIMYVTIGCTGYLFYGDKARSPIMDSLPKGNLLTYIAYIFITLHVAFAAPVYLCSFCLEQERWLKIDLAHLTPTKEFLYRVILRGGVGATLTLVAMFVPHFSALCGLFGAVSNCIVVFLVPVGCHYKLFGYQNRPLYHHLFCALILIAGFYGLIFGTWAAFQDLELSIKKAAEAAVKN
ncbi:hypothetical protein L0F63_004063, partial [Massospora cicadina]